MAAKFYFTTLAARPLTFSGRVFKFLVCGISSGRACGVYKAEDPAEIAVLDDAVRGKRGIKEVSPEEGAELEKKTAQIQTFASGRESGPRVVQPPILPQLAVESAPGVPANGRPTGTTPNENLLSGPTHRPSIVDLLRQGKVNPPRPFAQSDAKVKKASARADRAKIRVARPSE